MNTILDKFQEQLNGKVLIGEKLAKYTTFKIGGPAKYYYNCQTRDDLIKAILEARKLGVPMFVLGGGSNVLISDKGFDGLVIKNSSNRLLISKVIGEVKKGDLSQHTFLEVDAGHNFNQLVRFTIESGLSGLEMHLGLPGTVGGALYMNSKWMHPVGYVGDAVYQAEIITNNNRIKQVKNNYFKFDYDYSRLQETGDIVTRVIFKLKKSDKKKLWKTANNAISYRRDTQPFGVFTAGCMFQNLSDSQLKKAALPGGSASSGLLIDKLGLKGKEFGDAYISDKHANFIINRGNASARDVIQLANLIRKKAKKEHNINLTFEVVLV